MGVHVEHVIVENGKGFLKAFQFLVYRICVFKMKSDGIWEYLSYREID